MKYHNKPTTIYGIRFDSKKEADRYLVLHSKLQAGEISALRRQVTFELCPKQKTPSGRVLFPVHYIADFVYENDCGKTVVEDVKGFKTKDYIIKKKLMYYVHGIEVIEV